MMSRRLGIDVIPGWSIYKSPKICGPAEPLPATGFSLPLVLLALIRLAVSDKAGADNDREADI